MIGAVVGLEISSEPNHLTAFRLRTVDGPMLPGGFLSGSGEIGRHFEKFKREVEACDPSAQVWFAAIPG
jgi:hypothetical protein